MAWPGKVILTDKALYFEVLIPSVVDTNFRLSSCILLIRIPDIIGE